MAIGRVARQAIKQKILNEWLVTQVNFTLGGETLERTILVTPQTTRNGGAQCGNGFFEKFK